MSRCFVLMLALLLLLSCQSTAEKPEDAIANEIAAVLVLSEDMVNREMSVDREAIADLIPSSYSCYEKFVPMYSVYKEQYASSLSSIVVSVLDSPDDIIRSEVSVLSANPGRFIESDTSLSSELRSQCYDRVRSCLFDELEARRDDLERAFAPSFDEFESIRLAYLNLLSSGYRGEIPENAGMVDIEDLAEYAAECYFVSLEDAERTLKNRPLSEASDPIYTVFWGS